MAASADSQLFELPEDRSVMLEVSVCSIWVGFMSLTMFVHVFLVSEHRSVLFNRHQVFEDFYYRFLNLIPNRTLFMFNKILQTH